MQFDLTDPAPFSPAKLAAALRALLLGLARLFYFPLGDRRSYLIIPFQSYLQRTFLRFERLVARHEAGTLLPPRKRPKRAASSRKTPRLRFPSRKNWVVAELGHHAATHRHAPLRARHALRPPGVRRLHRAIPPGPAPPAPDLPHARHHPRLHSAPPEASPKAPPGQTPPPHPQTARSHPLVPQLRGETDEPPPAKIAQGLATGEVRLIYCD